MRAARLTALVIAAALPAPAATAGTQQTTAILTPFESGVLGDINIFRREHHVAPLRLNARLAAAAQAHTVEMAQQGYFSHESSNGALFWKRIQSFYAASPWSYWSVGENLLWSSPDVSPARALQMWLKSPEHRANLLNPRWREIGIAAVHEDAAPGVFRVSTSRS